MKKTIEVKDKELIAKLNSNFDKGKTETDTLREFEDSLSESYESIRECVPISARKNAGLELLRQELKKERENKLIETLGENLSTDGQKPTRKPYEAPAIREAAPVEHKPLTAPYEYVNHPTHYNNYDVEVIDMMSRIWGKDATALWCKMTAYKYRMRMGTKPDNTIVQDLAKEQWYLNKAKELERK